MSELTEDIADVKKLEFGRKIFEAVEAEFKKFRKSDLTEAEQALAEAQDKLADAEKRLYDIEHERLAEARNAKTDELLSALSGNAKEQMKIILSNVATEKLEEAYKVYIGRVLKESVVDAKKTEAQPAKIVETKEAKAPAKVVTGNEETELVEDVKPSDQTARMRVLAGLAR